jgi:hypothetical protein
MVIAHDHFRSDDIVQDEAEHFFKRASLNTVITEDREPMLKRRPRGKSKERSRGMYD